jgi:hypothetical protein
LLPSVIKPAFKDLHKLVKGNLSHCLTNLRTVMTQGKVHVIKFHSEAWESVALQQSGVHMFQNTLIALFPRALVFKTACEKLKYVNN